MVTIDSLFTSVLAFVENNPIFAKYITTISRWIFVILAVYILMKSIMSLLSTRVTPEVWGYLSVEDGVALPITHWENIIGKSSSVDLRIELDTISNTQALLIRRKDGKWMFKDLNSKNGTVINGIQLIPRKKYIINPGDEIIMGGARCTLAAISVEEEKNNDAMRSMDKKPVSPWPLMVAITAFQFLTMIQLIIGMGTNLTPGALLSIPLLSATMWIYVILFRAMGSKGFEMEMIAFFMSTIGLAVTTSANPTLTMKQYIATLVGIFIFIFMCIYMRDLKRTEKIKPVLAALAIGLLLFNIIFGTTKFGAANWVTIGGISIQPSEIVKLAFICIGAATMENLFNKKNLYGFMLFSLFCLACLAKMGDFGGALIFFVTYLVISFMRSGDFSRLILTIGAAGIMGILVLRFRPYILSRFKAWGHVWEPDFINGMGYQQTRTMSYASGGGMLGLGAGNGSLKTVAASNTDLVFGFVTEEWGLIIAILLVLCIITLSLFAVNSIVAGRSAFYTIAACGAATMMIFQTMLNIFGAVDLFPLTGVTFPFVSTGGTSAMCSWAMLAYFKAADMRKDASLAIKRRP